MGHNRYSNEEIDFIKNNIQFYKNGIKFEYERFIEAFNKMFDRDLTIQKFYGIIKHRKINLGEPNWKMINDLSAKSNYVIGDERTTGRYTFVKVSNDCWNDCWKPKHVLIYEQYHNVKVNNDEYISFLDRNTKNFDIDNLVLLTNKGLGKMFQFNHIKDIEIRKSAYTLCKTECMIEEIIIKKEKKAWKTTTAIEK